MMLDPGRYFAEAIYFLQYTLAQILWAIDRSLLSIAIIAESINTWVTDNVGYFVQLLVNGLSAPLGGMFILALTALGFWYVLNNIVPTGRWVDPSKLVTYGLIAFFFFSSPIVVINMMEDLRQSLNAGVDQALIDGAAGNIFDTSMNGTDTGLPGAIPDVNSDGVVGSFDLVAAFMAVSNIDELDSTEFPVVFEATYFPFGDPSGIDLSDEADQELAKALASDGIERLFFALFAIPTAIAEHFLRLALTGVAMFLYLGVPLAMLFAFFIYTQAFLGAYLRQFVNLLIETFLSVIIVAIMIGLLAAASQQGVGLFIGASVITLIVLLWRIKSALKLAAAAFNLFGGAILTGGAGGMELVNMGKQAAAGTVGLAGAALTGGATVALGGATLASAAALQADGRAGGAYLGADPAKTDGRVRQLKTISGYALGRSDTVRHAIEGMHETRTLSRNFRDGEAQPHDPDVLDYLRAGSSMSGFGSSPWLAMRLSPSLRGAYDQIGGRRYGYGLLAETFDDDDEPVDASGVGQRDGPRPDSQDRPLAENGTREPWHVAPASPQQRDYLRQLSVDVPEELTRRQASDLIDQARQQSWRERGVISRNADGPIRPDPELLGRFAGLEQAIEALTETLINPEIVGRLAGERVPDPSSESINGPIPDWLREEEPEEGDFRDGRMESAGPDSLSGSAQAQGGGMASEQDRVQDVNIVRVAPDLDKDGREDKYETDEGSQGAAMRAGTIRLEPDETSRQQTIHTVLERLQEPDSLTGQTAYKTLVVFTGEENASLLQEAVRQHSAQAVQETTTATADLLAQYRSQAMSDAGIMAAFQSGEAATAVRQALASAGTEMPLSDAQLAAVADTVLLPKRRLARRELAAVIGEQVAAGESTEQAVADAIGMPAAVATGGFGGQTGNVRGVMAGAQAMNLSPADLTRIADLIRDGLREVVQAELVGRGYRPEMVRDFVSNFAALPAVVVVPQSTATPPAGSGRRSQQSDDVLGDASG
jgi:hypothetical protein